MDFLRNLAMSCLPCQAIPCLTSSYLTLPCLVLHLSMKIFFLSSSSFLLTLIIFYLIMSQAKGVVFNIVGGNDLTLQEVRAQYSPVTQYHHTLRYTAPHCTAHMHDIHSYALHHVLPSFFIPFFLSSFLPSFHLLPLPSFLPFTLSPFLPSFLPFCRSMQQLR